MFLLFHIFMNATEEIQTLTKVKVLKLRNLIGDFLIICQDFCQLLVTKTHCSWCFCKEGVVR